jgi:hypothetical protein
MNDMAAVCEHVISQSGGLRHTDFAALDRSLRRNINSARCIRPGRAGRPSRLELSPSRATAALHAASDGDPGCLDCSMLCSTGRNWLWAALGVGAKVGANVHSHQATSSLRCRSSTPHRATPGYVWRLGGADLGAGGRGFESSHPRSFSNLLSTSGNHSGGQRLLRHAGQRGSASAHVGSYLSAALTPL